MLRKGDVLHDGRFGERYLVLEAAGETGGGSVRIEDAARPGPGRRPTSAHPNQEERFEVLSGTLGLMVDGEERLLEPGEAFVVPPGARHLPRNAGDGELRFVAEMRPAGRFEGFLAEITAANNSGREGLPYFLTAASVLHRYPDVERPTLLPRPLERALFAVLAGAGRLLGLYPPRARAPNSRTEPQGRAHSAGPHSAHALRGFWRGLLCHDCARQSREYPASNASERREEILRAYQERASLRGLAPTFGISRNTLTRWLKKSR